MLHGSQAILNGDKFCDFYFIFKVDKVCIFFHKSENWVSHYIYSFIALFVFFLNSLQHFDLRSENFQVHGLFQNEKLTIHQRKLEKTNVDRLVQRCSS